MTLTAGDKAPNFTLPRSTGEAFTLSDVLGARTVVLFFYPKDDTPGCTVEACTFRDNYEAFVEAGAEVVGVSSDSGASHDRFATKHKLPMTLLTDADGKVRALYGVQSTLGLHARPGDVRHRPQGHDRPHVSSRSCGSKTHVEQALAVVKGLERPEAVPARP